MVLARLKAKIFELLQAGFGDSGEALDELTRVQMESALGYDLRDVRIHETEQAGKLARRLRADAFTIGADIYFDQGKLNTVTGEGRGLLAHELTHFIQQVRPQTVVPGYFGRESEMIHMPNAPGMYIQPSCTELPVAAAPQFAMSSPGSAAGSSTSETMEAQAQRSERISRRTAEADNERQTEGSTVSAEEIAEIVYQIMHRELLLENDRTRR
jgi:hypothetical protein